MNYKSIRLVRRLYLIFCILLGFLSPIYCNYLLPEYNPMEQPLSVFGIKEDNIKSNEKGILKFF